MMNRSRIEYCNFSWNPVTGCRHSCPYCYAAKQAKRLSGDVRVNKGSNQLRKDENGLYILDNPFRNQSGKVIPDPVGFEPVMHRYRLEMPAQKKKPANIFVCSMADLFGVWVPDSWIDTSEPARHGAHFEEGRKNNDFKDFKKREEYHGKQECF